MREQIRKALTEAMKSRDERRVSTLRLVNAAIKDRDIAARSDGREGVVTDREILEILARMIKQRRESVVSYEQAGRVELAQQEKDEIDIIQSFMPQQLSEEEVRTAVEKTVRELGAETLKDMGKVMGKLKERHAGQMDFGKAGAVVKSILG